MPRTLDRSDTTVSPKSSWNETISLPASGMWVRAASHEIDLINARTSEAAQAHQYFSFHFGSQAQHGARGTAYLGLPTSIPTAHSEGTCEFEPSAAFGALFFNTQQTAPPDSQVLIDPPLIVQDVALDALELLRGINGGAAAYLTIVSIARKVASIHRLSGRVSLRVVGEGDDRDLIALVVFADSSQERRFELLRAVAGSYGVYLDQLTEGERAYLSRFIRLQVKIDAGTR